MKYSSSCIQERTLILQFLSEKATEKSSYHFEEHVSSTAWSDQLGRYRVWAANVGHEQSPPDGFQSLLATWVSTVRGEISDLLQEKVLKEALELIGESNVSEDCGIELQYH